MEPTRSVYRVVWLAFCSVVGVVGGIVAFTWPLGAIIMLLVMAALVGGVLAMITFDPEDSTRLPRDRRGVVATSAALSGGGCVASAGLGALLGAPMAMLVMALAIGGSPWSIRRYVRWLRKHGHLSTPPSRPIERVPGELSPTAVLEFTPPPEAESDARAEVETAELSDDALCLVWRASFSALQNATSSAQRLQVVEERRAYLDELERRNAHGLAAWLASGARAAGDPSRFVLGDGGAGRSPIDWDGLIHGTDK